MDTSTNKHMSSDSSDDNDDHHQNNDQHRSPRKAKAKALDQMKICQLVEEDTTATSDSNIEAQPLIDQDEMVASQSSLADTDSCLSYDNPNAPEPPPTDFIQVSTPPAVINQQQQQSLFQQVEGVNEEVHRLQDEFQRYMEEQQRRFEEKQRCSEEEFQRRLEEFQRRLEEEQRRFQEEQRRFQEEQRRFQEEFYSYLEDAKRQFEEKQQPMLAKQQQLRNQLGDVPDRCFLSIHIEASGIDKRIDIRLFNQITPSLCDHFRSICENRIGIEFNNIEFEYLISNHYIQSKALHVTTRSGDVLSDRTASKPLSSQRHDRRGLISINPTKHLYQFVFTLGAAPMLDKDYVVIGEVISDMEIFDVINQNGIKGVEDDHGGGAPRVEILISSIGSYNDK